MFEGRLRSPWWVVFGAALGLMVSNGPIMSFSFGVLIKPIAESLHWSRADVTAGLAISGRVDRLVVQPTRVLVVDFKTNRPAPDRIENTDPAYLTQMALYVAVLRAIFVGRRIEAALVWTDGPRLMPVPENLIDQELTKLRRGG